MEGFYNLSTFYKSTCIFTKNNSMICEHSYTWVLVIFRALLFLGIFYVLSTEDIMSIKVNITFIEY